ncbi:MAG: CoxE, partial [Chloroflexi bacterium]|nr:CoxE [Chloroflexota bacterium]
MTQGHISEHIVGFVHLLRSMGIKVGSGQLLDFGRALTFVGLTDREALHDAARCTLINKPEDLP